MTRSRRLQRIVKLADTAREMAATELRQSDAQLRQHQQQLDELKQFRAEYADTTRHAGGPVSAGNLQQQRRFIQQLDTAIGMLETRLEEVTLTRDRQQQCWLAQRRRVQTLGDVQRRAKRSETLDGERRTQNEIDDRGPR
ncbi:MAG: flagellar export protein FliJ [Gammaproteobacteria bacterium]|nr:flagellar export protein FliJ [Gammaproteobacteria bacterium]